MKEKKTPYAPLPCTSSRACVCVWVAFERIRTTLSFTFADFSPTSIEVEVIKQTLESVWTIWVRLLRMRWNTSTSPPSAQICLHVYSYAALHGVRPANRRMNCTREIRSTVNNTGWVTHCQPSQSETHRIIATINDHGTIKMLYHYYFIRSSNFEHISFHRNHFCFCSFFSVFFSIHPIAAGLFSAALLHVRQIESTRGHICHQSCSPQTKLRTNTQHPLVCVGSRNFSKFPTLKFIDNYIEITKMRRQKKAHTHTNRIPKTNRTRMADARVNECI